MNLLIFFLNNFMKLLYLILYFFSVVSFSQNNPLKVTLKTITTENTHPKETKFTIDYEITNLTNNNISFFLIPNTLIANAAASMTLFPIYKLYQNGIFTELDGPFYEKIGPYWEDLKNLENPDSDEAKIIIQKMQQFHDSEYLVLIENYKKNGGKSNDDHWIYKNQKLLQTIVTLNPNETKSFTIKTYWDKKRYYKQDDYEYYLDEKDNYTFELILDLKSILFKDSLSASELEKIASDPNFIQGVFTSNKVPINFK